MTRDVAVQRWPVDPNAPPWMADGGLVEIGVGHHDHGVLAAHLAGDLGAALRGLHVERTADGVRSSERDRAQLGRGTIASPTIEPLPTTMLKTPGGSPASS